MKLLILSDIFGNWPALEAVIQAEPDFDAVAFCGDAVGFGPCPVECIHWLREHANFAVRGNHDNAVAFQRECHCQDSLRELSQPTRTWHEILISDADREFLRGLPILDWFEWQGKHFRMAHATPRGDLFEFLPMAGWENRVKDLDGTWMVISYFWGTLASRECALSES